MLDRRSSQNVPDVFMTTPYGLHVDSISKRRASFSTHILKRLKAKVDACILKVFSHLEERQLSRLDICNKYFN